VDLTGPAGRLEALVNEGAPDACWAALVCHPHPLGGGNLHNKVVYHAMKALNDPAWGLGWPVLRFNFRGTGLSEGAHDGAAESGDVLAALDWLENEYKRPLALVGFSFGAVMAVKALSEARGGQDRSGTRANVAALAALGLPIRVDGRDYNNPILHDCAVPKLFLSGDHDQFAPAAQLARVIGFAAEPKRLVFLPGSDHFFAGQLDLMQQALAGWLKEQLS
jgi:alpha/beta superfamily hydrolase